MSESPKDSLKVVIDLAPLFWSFLGYFDSIICLQIWLWWDSENSSQIVIFVLIYLTFSISIIFQFIGSELIIPRGVDVCCASLTFALYIASTTGINR